MHGATGRQDLPADLTSFVGRRKETADIRRTLERSRLVTVTGIAGVGKTRVAVKAAESMRRAFPDGVVFVELSSLSNPERLPEVVARALEIPDQTSTTAAGMLADYLADKQLLLVLDTCEHLVDACARLAGSLLAAARGLRVLATSRQPLGAPGEHSFVIRPMAVPGAGEADGGDGGDGLAACESVALFLDRVATVDPGFRLTPENAPAVAELCRRLDGIPLALELAAVRARSLTVGRILQLMSERFWLAPEDSDAGDVRHSTMQAAIAWSNDLCTAEERLLWSRLSIFPGRFDLVAAEAVCAYDGLPAERVYPAIDGLVGKSILVCEKEPDRTTYRMLDSIREYGAARSREAGHGVLPARHRDHYARLAAEAAVVPPGGDQAEQWRRVRAEWPNLRAALEFCAADPAETDAGVRLALDLEYLWIACGMGREGRHYLEWFVQVGRLAPGLRVRVLLLLCYVLVAQGDLRAARQTIEESSGLLAGIDDPTCRTRLLKIRGTLAYAEGDLALADTNLTAAIGLLSTGDTPGLMALAAMTELGITRVGLGRLDEAAEVLETCGRICDATGQSWARSWADVGLSMVLRARGELAGALAVARKALAVQRRMHDASGASLCLELVAWLATGQEDPAWATRLLHASHGQWRQVRRPLYGSPHFLAEHARCEERLRRALPPADYEDAAAEGSAMSMDEAIAHALRGTGAPPAAEEPAVTTPLSPRELEVADLVADGLTNREIARRLVVGRRTVDTHVEHILAKLDFSARSQIAAWAIRHREGGAPWPSGVGPAISRPS